jgi:hypothetical protein
MLHVPLPMVNVELVQLPCVCGVGPRSTCRVPLVVVVVGALEEGDVGLKAAGACVVTLAAPGAVVTLEEPPVGGGSL